MVAKEQNPGQCYLCGQSLKMQAIYKHLLNQHDLNAGDEPCYLFLAEDEEHLYWLFFDIPESMTLDAIDRFLREIWFDEQHGLGTFQEALSGENYTKETPLQALKPGHPLRYEIKTEPITRIELTPIQATMRLRQAETVRVLARNTAYEENCGICNDRPADVIIPSGWPPMYICGFCMDSFLIHEYYDFANSPGCGKCKTINPRFKYVYKAK